MKDNIIISSGTAGGAMGLEALQKYEAMIQECEQRLKNLSTDSHEYQNLKILFPSYCWKWSNLCYNLSVPAQIQPLGVKQKSIFLLKILIFFILIIFKFKYLLIGKRLNLEILTVDFLHIY